VSHYGPQAGWLRNVPSTGRRPPPGGNRLIQLMFSARQDRLRGGGVLWERATSRRISIVAMCAHRRPIGDRPAAPRPRRISSAAAMRHSTGVNISAVSGETPPLRAASSPGVPDAVELFYIAGRTESGQAGPVRLIYWLSILACINCIFALSPMNFD
jgi:hypothetical protein